MSSAIWESDRYIYSMPAERSRAVRMGRGSSSGLKRCSSPPAALAGRPPGAGRTWWWRPLRQRYAGYQGGGGWCWRRCCQRQRGQRWKRQRRVGCGGGRLRIWRQPYCARGGGLRSPGDREAARCFFSGRCSFSGAIACTPSLRRSRWRSPSVDASASAYHGAGSGSRRALVAGEVHSPRSSRRV